MFILYILLAIVILLFMVLIHELGHYTIGRLLKFKITEFSVGFGKAIFSRTNKRGEKISLRIFPLGGYCAFAGEGEEGEENDPAAFNNQAPWKRILVFLAGVAFNFLTAIIFSFILLCAVGYDIPQVTQYSPLAEHVQTEEYVVNPNAENLQVGDVIFSINGKTIDFAYGSTFNDIIKDEQAKLGAWLKANPEASFTEFPTMNFKVRRDGKMIEVPVAFYQISREKTETAEDGTEIIKTEKVYSIGIHAKAYKHSFWEAFKRAIPFAVGLAWVVLKSLWMLITFQLGVEAIGGPITTIATIASVTQASALNILVLIPLISANLAIFNLLPFPALDGSHVVFTTIEWIRKKPINRKVENIIHTVGLAILFGLVIVVDILHFVL